nr:hypothetical protein BCU01_18255 [Vibrio splendidus]
MDKTINTLVIFFAVSFIFAILFHSNPVIILIAFTSLYDFVITNIVGLFSFALSIYVYKS